MARPAEDGAGGGPGRPRRRDVLKTAAAAASLAIGRPGPARAQRSGAPARAALDAVLRQAVDARDVPGVVAMAATDAGLLYEGAFGVRALGQPTPMTPDTVFRIASMTKAFTSVAAMQLVEQGRVKLDDPLADVDRWLSAPRVLEGFDAAGVPRLRPARRPIALRHLLTHTAGFTYDTWDAATTRYVRAMKTPSRATGKLASIRTPLAFEPGERWQYGVNTHWAGRVVEVLTGRPLDAHFREALFAPLGMKDTGYVVSPAQRGRQARVHARKPDGALAIEPWEKPPAARPEYWSGGGTMYSTAGDYLAFLRMLLAGGRADGARVLRPETVADMHRNHTGELRAGALRSEDREQSNDLDLFPGAPTRWGLAHMLNLQPGPNGRSAGTVGWAGIFNTYYWIDPARRVTGVIMMQIAPFGDPRALALYGRFERAVYDALGAG